MLISTTLPALAFFSATAILARAQLAKSSPGSILNIFGSESICSGKNHKGGCDVALDGAEEGPGVSEEEDLTKRQVAPRVPTVFSTSTIFSTIVVSDEPPTTSTVLVTVTDTLTFVDPAQGRTTQTFTLSTSIQPRPRARQRNVQQDDSPTTTSSHLLPMASMLAATATTTRHNLNAEVSGRIAQEKRQDLVTITSVIIIISRTLLTVAPTALVTSTARLFSTVTITPPVSTTVAVTNTVVVGSDGVPTTLTPQTTPAVPTATDSSVLSPGGIAGVAVGGFVGAVLLLLFLVCCCKRRQRSHSWKRHETDPNASSIRTSEAAERGTVEHTETFGVGVSPPASVARGAREEASRDAPLQTSSPEDVRIVINQPSMTDQSQEMQQQQQQHGPPTDARRSLFWRPTNFSLRPRQSDLDAAIDEDARGMLRPSTDSIRELREQLGQRENDPSVRHPSAVPAPLRIPWLGSQRRGQGEEEIHDDSSSTYDSNEAQPPSPLASSGVWGLSPTAPSFRSSLRRSRDKASSGEASTLGELPRFSGNRRVGLAGTDSRDGSEQASLTTTGQTTERSHEAAGGSGSSWIPAFPEPGEGKIEHKEAG